MAVGTAVGNLMGAVIQKGAQLATNAVVELGKSLAKVDGAIHVGADLHMHGFACLMDGLAVPSEDRSRGARYNSALRFTAERENIIVVVVSSDKPVSVIQGGVELTARCDWESLAKLSTTPPMLEDWLDMNGAVSDRLGEKK